MPGKSFNVVTKFLAHDGVTKKLKKMGKAAGGVARQGAVITAAASAAVVSIFNVNKEFQLSMNRIEARLGNATGDQLNQLRDMAKELGKTTAFSASQAADGMGFLAMAGWKVNDILAATPDLLNLAAAAEMDLARAADITSNVMGAFEMDATRAGEAADVLAALTSSANVDMEMLADTFKMAAPLANAYGATLKDAGVAAGFLGNIGIQGTSAGTAMKGLFSVMSNPPPKAAAWFEELNIQTSEIDKNGKRVMRDFSGTMAELGKKLSKMSQPERLKALGDIFGKIVGPSAIAMSKDLGQANSQFLKLSESMESVEGRSQKMADIMMKGAPGAVARLMASIEGLMLAMGEAGLLDAVVGLITGLTGLISKLTEYAPWLTKILGAVVVLSAGITAAATAIVLLAKAFTIVKTAVIALKLVWVAFNAVFIASPIGLVIGAIVILVGLFALLARRVGGIKSAFIILGQTILQAIVAPVNTVVEIIKGMLRLLSKIPGMGDKYANMADTIGNKQDELNNKFTGTTNIIPGSRLMESIIQGDGTTPATTATNGTVDVNVTNNSPEKQDIQGTTTGSGLKMKLKTGGA